MTRTSFQAVLDATSAATSSMRTAIESGRRGSGQFGHNRSPGCFGGHRRVHRPGERARGGLPDRITERVDSRERLRGANARTDPGPDRRTHRHTRPAHGHPCADGNPSGNRVRDGGCSHPDCHAAATRDTLPQRPPRRQARFRPTPTPSPTIEPSPSASEPPSPDDEGSGLLPWILVLGAGGLGAAIVVLWYANRNDEGEPPDDLGTPPDDFGDVPPPTGACRGGKPATGDASTVSADPADLASALTDRPARGGGAEGGIRTHDRRFTKPLLYP